MTHSHDTDDAVVRFLIDREGLLDMVLREHVDDGRGDCRACPGPQSGRRRFPCDVRRVAERASARRTVEQQAAD